MEVFIYIDDWKYKSDQEKARFYGHPLQGKVYRAHKDDEDKYKVDLPARDNAAGIILIGEGKNNDLEHCEYKFTEINDDNLVKLDISLDDLDLILQSWHPQTVAKDEKLIELEEEIEEVKEEFSILDSVDNVQAFEEISNNLNLIVESDKRTFNVLRLLIRIISEDYKTKDDELALVRSIIKQIKQNK